MVRAVQGPMLGLAGSADGQAPEYCGCWVHLGLHTPGALGSECLRRKLVGYADLDWKSCGWSPPCSAVDAVAGCRGFGPASLRCKGQVFLSRSGEMEPRPPGGRGEQMGLETGSGLR